MTSYDQKRETNEFLILENNDRRAIESKVNSSSDLCTLPAISENSQYTVAGVAQGDGTNVAVGTAFTLLCDQGYTFKNTNSLLQTCTEGLATSDIRNECFRKF